MKKFINDPYDVVDEMLEGFLDVHKKYVHKLDTARTVVRVDAPVADKVGVITGGGSGIGASLTEGFLQRFGIFSRVDVLADLQLVEVEHQVPAEADRGGWREWRDTVPIPLRGRL